MNATRALASSAYRLRNERNTTMNALTTMNAVAPAVPVSLETIECPFADHPVRAVVFSDGSKWVVAKDICGGLGLLGKDPLARLHLTQKVTLAKGATPVEQGKLLFPGSLSRLALVSRGGMNDLILESRKPAARAFRQWLTDTVIPRLQDTGAYVMGEEKLEEPGISMELIDARFAAMMEVMTAKFGQIVEQRNAAVLALDATTHQRDTTARVANALIEDRERVTSFRNKITTGCGTFQSSKSTSSDDLSRRVSSASIASRMKDAMRLGPTRASIRSRMDSGKRTTVAFM